MTIELEKLREQFRNEKTEMMNEIIKLRTETEELTKRKIEIETRYEKETLLLKNEI